MPPTLPGPRALRQTAGAVGAVALLALGAAPAGAADPGPGLVLGRIGPIDGVKPGSEFTVPTSFTNTGTAALGKVWMSYSVTRGLSHTEVPSNCLRYEIGSFDEQPGSSDVICEFDQRVEPGVVYAPERPLTLKALDRALYDELRVTVDSADTGPGDGASEPVRGTGPAVKLVERPDDTPAAPGSARHDGWDAVDVKVTAKNTADFRVNGNRLKGRVGDTVPLVVKFTNAGPGWVLREIGAGATRVHITMPAGTSVAKADGFCKSMGSRTYDCGTSQAWINEGGGETYDFKLKIDKSVSGAKGSVALAGQPRPFDPDKSNDTADILLDVSGHGSTGGSGSTSSTGGSGSASTGGSGSASGSSSGSGTGTTGGSSTSGTSGSSSTGGDLASTGSGQVLPLTAAAAGAVVVGAGAVLVVRRRAARQR
ncbi:hypothetical protein ACIRU3_19020 [Streptomyces sp. NPDC101151]|uniref:hypothetical protein n=1 Tax=Streptomyces sp. NPDC101151 TaxID=3366115 RepID=UPI0038291BDB